MNMPESHIMGKAEKRPKIACSLCCHFTRCVVWS